MAAETFGCSDSMPAIFVKGGAVAMGEAPPHALLPGTCMEIPTGGQLPEGADAVAMLEYAEDYGTAPSAYASPSPLRLILYSKGTMYFQENLFCLQGRRLTFQDVGALAAMGITAVPVRKQPRVAIISTGDELVAPHQVPGARPDPGRKHRHAGRLCGPAGRRALVPRVPERPGETA